MIRTGDRLKLAPRRYLKNKPCSRLQDVCNQNIRHKKHNGKSLLNNNKIKLEPLFEFYFSRSSLTILSWVVVVFILFFVLVGLFS